MRDNMLFGIVRRRVHRLLTTKRRRRAVRTRRKDLVHFKQHQEIARALIQERIVYWNQFYKLHYNRIAIRNQGTRWGSCSTKGNLNFNYRLLFIAPELVDYVVVHELCHLAHFNHGKDFWTLVGQTIPDYKTRVEMLHAVTKHIAVTGIQNLESRIHSST
jgi:predicted metal-dependent hydrolase